MMDQSINFVVYVKVLSEAKEFPTDSLPNKELGDHTRPVARGKEKRPRWESNPRLPDLTVRCSTARATRHDGGKS